MTGWLWYLVMLVPVIGIVQVGVQARADRYTYLPQIGLYLLLTWAAADLCAGWRHRRVVLGGCATVILVALIFCARTQTAYWRNSETLWTHTLACTSDNVIAHNNLGNALLQKGKVDEAIAHFQKALQIKPDYAEAHYNLGNALLQKGKSGRSDRPLPKGAANQARLRGSPQQPRQRSAPKGKSGRSDHPLPKGAANQPRLRGSPQQPRQRSSPKGQSGRSDRPFPKGAANQARLRGSPLQPRQRSAPKGTEWTKRSPITKRRCKSTPTMRKPRTTWPGCWRPAPQASLRNYEAHGTEPSRCREQQAEGVIMTWQDGRSWTDWDVYAQAIDSTGAVKWTSNGVGVYVGNTTSVLYTNQQLVSDGQGGAIIAWQDDRNHGVPYIYAQAINNSGTVQWTHNGVAICTTVNNFNSKLVSDGQGGAIITWQDKRRGSSFYDVYAQAIDSTGAVKWTQNGVVISTTTAIFSLPTNPQLVSDGQGGAIITWQDYRNGHYYEVYAQAIDSTGTVKWTQNGLAISIASTASSPQLVSDGQGGALITWQDYRNDTGDIYAQAIDSTGTIKWTQNGVAISIASTASSPQLVSDGQGGAIITWQDDRNDSHGDIYAQYVDSAIRN